MPLGVEVVELVIMDVVKKSLTSFNPYTNQNQSTYINFDQISLQITQMILMVLEVVKLQIQTETIITLSGFQMNNHAWYGMVSNLNTKLNENLSLNVGFRPKNLPWGPLQTSV